LNNYEHGKFVLSNLAAKRAKQLREGAPPLVQVDSIHPLTIALAEIAAGKIKPIMTAGMDIMIEEPELSVLLDGDTIPGELGMLLPALDETEVALVTTVGEDEIDAEHDSEETLTLSGLVEDEEEVEVAPAEEDTLSLSDIADQETAEEDSDDDEV
ncbi:MAG TPA: DNA-directed RNA polymerase subunit omega, partial [Fimbriimonas sp.]|nr:DNA-directed RNA polymerase subunit omega [Fimbriimonas sp.]